MNPTSSPPSVPQVSPRPRLGLAIASLVLGVLAFLSSIVVVGALFGLIGLLLGIAHLFRRQGRNAMAWTGIVLSIIGIGVSVGVVTVAYPHAKKVIEAVRQGAQGQGEAGFEQWHGVLAPDLSVTTLDGKTITLNELKGKRVVLDFWATWCPPCVKEIPHFIRLRSETPEDELVILGLSAEDEATLKSFVTKKGINYPIASADTYPSPYKDVVGIPTTFFIDRKGVIQDVLVGYHDFEDLKARALAPDFEGDPKPAPAPAGENPTAKGNQP